MRTPLLLGSGVHYFPFNTKDTDGAPITLAGTPAVRLSVNGGDYVDDALTLSVDHAYDGASQVTGLHRVALDVDDASLALADGDEVDVILSAGTVDAVSVAGTVLAKFVVLADGLTAAEIADIPTGTGLNEADTIAAVEEALANYRAAKATTKQGQGAGADVS